MAHEAPVTNGSNRFASPQMPIGVVTSLSELGNDLTTLAELQWELTAIDAKESVGKIGTGAAILAVAAVLGLGAVPVLLAGLAWMISTTFSLSLGWSLIGVALGALVLAGLIGWLSLGGIKTGLGGFQRSREELGRNVRWIKKVIAAGGMPRSRRF